MDPQELLTAPASTLTRKQRRERAALKKRMADQMMIPAGYALGRVRVAEPPLMPAALDLGRLGKIGGPGVYVRMLDSP